MSAAPDDGATIPVAPAAAQHDAHDAGATGGSRRYHPSLFIVFGVTGDLAARKILPALYALHEQGQRVQDIGGFGTAGREDREIQALAEDAGEALRHLYVGLTRAQSQVVTWWAPTANTSGAKTRRRRLKRTTASSILASSLSSIARTSERTRPENAASRRVCLESRIRLGHS